MSRPVLIATSVAAILIVVVVLVTSGALDSSADTEMDPTRAGSSGPVVPVDVERTRAVAGSPGVIDDPPEADTADARDVGTSTDRGTEPEVGADSEPDESDVDVGSEAPAAIDGAELRERAEVVEAFRRALDRGDLGLLQDLLLSELTTDGTLLGPEALPMLVRSAIGAADPGLQKLALTHLERLEGVDPTLLRDGYLEYLTEAERPLEFQEVLERLVAVGREPVRSDATVAGLVGLLARGEREPYRFEIVRALGDLGNERAVPVLRDALESDDGQHETEYLDALSRIGGREAASLLVGVVSRSDSRDTVSVLENLRGRDVAPVLSSALSDPATERFHREALRKLGELKDPRTIPDVARFLDRTESSLAMEAIVSLSRYDDIRAVESLEAYAARYPDSAYRQHALNYAERLERRLATFRDEASEPAKEQPPEGR